MVQDVGRNTAESGTISIGQYTTQEIANAIEQPGNLELIDNVFDDAIGDFQASLFIGLVEGNPFTLEQLQAAGYDTGSRELDPQLDQFFRPQNLQAARTGFYAGNSSRLTLLATSGSQTVVAPWVTEGATQAFTLIRSGEDIDLSQSLTVNLSTSEDGQFQLPTAVTFQPGQSSLEFEAALINDGIEEGERAVRFSAESSQIEFNIDAWVITQDGEGNGAVVETPTTGDSDSDPETGSPDVISNSPGTPVPETTPQNPQLVPIAPSGTVIFDENFEDGIIENASYVPPSDRLSGIVETADGNHVYQITYEHDEFSRKVEWVAEESFDSIDVSFSTRLIDGLPIGENQRQWIDLKTFRVFEDTGALGEVFSTHVDRYSPSFENQGFDYVEILHTYGNEVTPIRIPFDGSLTDWTEFKYHMSWNTPGNADGVLMIWHDGELVFEDHNVTWFENNETLRPNGFWFGGNVSGGNSGQPIQPFRRQFDNVVASVNGGTPLLPVPADNLAFSEPEDVANVPEVGAGDTESAEPSTTPVGPPEDANAPRSENATVVLNEDFESGFVAPAFLPTTDRFSRVVDTQDGNNVLEIVYERDEFQRDISWSTEEGFDSIEVAYSTRLPEGFDTSQNPRHWAELKLFRVYEGTGNLGEIFTTVLQKYDSEFENQGVDRYELVHLFSNDVQPIRFALDSPEQWLDLRYFMEWNTQGNSDGTLMIWHDNELVYENHEIEWFDHDTLKPTGLWVGGNFSGGQNGQPIPSFRRQIDNVFAAINGGIPTVEASPQIIVQETGPSNLVSEVGTTDELLVSLSEAPSGNVVIDITPQQARQLTISAQQLTFTPENWEIPQAVSLAAVDDQLVEGTQAIDLTFSADGSSGDLFGEIEDLMVNILVEDNDPALVDNTVLEGVVALPGESGETATLDFSWLQRLAGFDNELGFFIVDDASGSLEGLPANGPGYAAAALSHASRQIIFRSGEGAGAASQFEVPAGSHLVFYLVQNATNEQLLANNPRNQLGNGPVAFFSNREINPDQFAHVQIDQSASGVWNFAWEDLVGGGDLSFTDAVIELDVEVSNSAHDGFASGILSLLSGGPSDYNLDFQFLQRFAEYNNEIGLFVADDSSGQLDGLRPGDEAYAAAALAHPSQQVIFESGEGTGAENQIRLSAGQQVVFYLVQNATTEDFLQSPAESGPQERPHVFFSITDANQDGFDHLRESSTGDNTWQLGWEDLLNGGDMSFTDAVINLSVTESNVDRADQVDRLAQQLVSDLGLSPNDIDFFDWGGRAERWVQGKDDWYFITPDGNFFRWDNDRPGSTAPLAGELLAHLDPRYYEDLDLFSGSTVQDVRRQLFVPFSDN